MAKRNTHTAHLEVCIKVHYPNKRAPHYCELTGKQFSSQPNWYKRQFKRKLKEALKLSEVCDVEDTLL